MKPGTKVRFGVDISINVGVGGNSKSYDDFPYLFGCIFTTHHKMSTQP